MVAPCWRLVLNGKSAGDDALRDAVAAIRDRGVALDVRVTWEAGDAERHVSEAISDGVATIIAAGGDGTLSEVAAALANRADAADALPSVALVPMGTANDFASAAGIPDTPFDAMALVLEQPPAVVDLLRISADGEVHWAANMASGGFGTDVTVETSEGMKKLLGGLAYVVTGMARLGRIEPVTARFNGPDFEWHGDFIALGIGNGPQAGGGQALCPDALVDDGLLELTIVPTLEGEVGATMATLLADGKHAALDRVAVRTRLPWVDVASDAPLTLNLDGEPVTATRFRIECVAGRLRMHLPAGCTLLSANGTGTP